jgi:hypothetical protein
MYTTTYPNGSVVFFTFTSVTTAAVVDLSQDTASTSSSSDQNRPDRIAFGVGIEISPPAPIAHVSSDTYRKGIIRGNEKQNGWVGRRRPVYFRKSSKLRG